MGCKKVNEYERRYCCTIKLLHRVIFKHSSIKYAECSNNIHEKKKLGGYFGSVGERPIQLRAK